ncbi:MAG: acetyl-CoA carboxylase carboxyltransferase subunit alpha [Waddliaceae bacterium]
MDILPHEKKIYEYLNAINHLKKQSKGEDVFEEEIHKLEAKLDQIKMDVFSKLTPWQRIQISRHPNRPHTLDYIETICDRFIELSGDRLYRDDTAVIGGLAKIGNLNCMLIGQEKGKDTESRVRHNFGMAHPEGFRKALRLMRLAEKFQLPVVTFLDTPGAYPGLEAEERGQGLAIAENLREMSVLKTAIIVVVIGEGCSGGALGMGVGDSIGMLEHAYYSVISPEGCASILWKDPGKNIDAAEALKLNSEDLQRFGVIDTIIKEPIGGAHLNPKEAMDNVKSFILDQWRILRNIPIHLLLDQRYTKFRTIGEFEEHEAVK